MHLFFDARTASWSGVGRYVVGLLAELDRNPDIELTVFADPKDKLSLEGSGRILHATSGVFSPRGIFELSAAVRSTAADLVHAPMFVAPYLSGAPLVVTIHDLIPVLMADVMPGAFDQRLYLALNRHAVRAARLVMTPSAHTRDDVVNILGIAPDKIRVVPHALDGIFSDRLPAKVDIKGKLGLEGDFILSMGNEKSNKNLTALVEAFAEIRKKSPVKLVLVGSPDERFPNVRRIIARLGLERDVLYTGRVDNDELVSLYIDALLFIFPSTYEGFGLPPLEAMACGTPVACSNSSSLPEVVGDDALLFDPHSVKEIEEAVLRAMFDPELRRSLGERGRERAKLFSWRRTAAQVVKVYEDAIRR